MPRQSNRELYELFRKTYPQKRLLFRPSTDSWELDGVGVTQGELARTVAFALDTTVNRVLLILTEASTIARMDAHCQLKDWLAQIEKRERCDKELRKWLRLMQRPDTSDLDHEAHVHALKQFMWQVKRSINKQSVVWHVAPIFWSKEGGTGKSTNICRLISPLAQYTRNVSVDELSEKFSGRLFAQTLVAFLDEFAGVDKADVGTLKAILTGKPIDRRSMHSESGFYSVNRLSCIASTNLAPPHGYIDTTGARRFWSIHCSGERMRDGTARMRAFDALDVDQIWAAVSVEDVCPAYTCARSVGEHMEAVRNENLRTRTSLETFCEDSLEPSTGARLLLRDFQHKYKDYCGRTRQLPLRGGYRELAKRLRDLNMVVRSPNNRFYLHDYDFSEETQVEA